jgi:HSP20 family protein
MSQEQQKVGAEAEEAKATAVDEGESSASSETQLAEDGREAQPIERHALGRLEPWSSPFAFVQRMMDEMDKMFVRFGGGGSPAPFGQSLFSPQREGIWSPTVETFERDGKLILRAELPGLEKKDVNVEVIEDELVISGQRKQVERETTKGRYYTERRYGSFERRMSLPADVSPESIEAAFDNGVLEVSFAIPEPKAKKRTIEVKSGGGSSEDGSPRSVH